MIKLIVSDIDGTMVGRSEALPEGIADFIRRIEDAGVMFTVATGRSDGYMDQRIRKMELTRPYIANNGATIMQGDTALLRKQFPISDIRHIVPRAEELEMSIIYTFAGVERVTRITPWIIHQGEKHQKDFVAEPFSEEEWNTLKADKILIYEPTRSGSIAEIEALCSDLPHASEVRYGDKAVELMEKSANKGSGLVELLSILGIGKDEVLVIGDDTNDVLLFQVAENSAAVANAKPALLPHAKYVCKNEEFEGVREAIRAFCGIEA